MGRNESRAWLGGGTTRECQEPSGGVTGPSIPAWGPRVTQEGPGGQLKAITDFPHNPSAQTGLAPRTDPSPSSSGTHLGKASNQ